MASFSVWHLLIFIAVIAGVVFLIAVVARSGKEASFTEKPLLPRARQLKASMAAVGLLMLVAIGLNLYEVSLLLADPEFGDIAQLDAINANIGRQQLLAIFMGICVIVATILGLCWIYRASANLWARKLPDVSYSPAGAIGFYFVPLLNLFVPYLAMRDIWRSSLKNAEPPQDAGTSILGIWWLLFICSLLANRAKDVLAGRAETIDQLMPLNIVSQLELILGLLLIACFWHIINRVTAAQSLPYSSSR